MSRLCLLFCLLVVTVTSCGRGKGPPVAAVTEISASPTTATESAPSIEWGPDDWPVWRGPQVDGVVPAQGLPTEWSDTQNVVWKAKLPGRGHSSPIVLGDRLYLTTADEATKVQSVLCLDRKDGAIVWQKEIHRDHFEDTMHHENTQATSTLACDGQQLYALFLNDRKIWATALNLKGDQVWQREVGPFASKFGYSASPVLYKSLVILGADHQQGGYLAALDRKSGEIVWRKSRPAIASFASPRVVSLAGKDQLVICGCKLVASYHPETGDLLWETSGTAESGVGTPVVMQDLVFASGGYPEQDTVALHGDGTVAWRKPVKAYCTSLLAHEGSLFLVGDDGVARCFEGATGDEKWKHRLQGNFRVSPILHDGNLYITNMQGKTFVFRASPEKFQSIAENQLGDEGFASPAVSRGQMFLRTADSSTGTRQEWLYCLAVAP